MSPLLAVLLPVCATLLGGFLVLRTHRNLRPWLSLSGGILLGLAFLDLLPEALEHGEAARLPISTVTGAMLGSILFFHLLDKAFDFHGHEGHGHTCDNDHHTEEKTHHPIKAWSRAVGISFHAFLDGLAIGGGFAANVRLGILVTLGLMLHKFTDGMTTVTLLHVHGGPQAKRRAQAALAALVLLPLLGLAVGNLLVPTPTAVAISLALIAGLFTHLPLSELLPEAHEGQPSRLGLLLTVTGIALMGLVTRLAG
jgi:zinc transporter ZupT